MVMDSLASFAVVTLAQLERDLTTDSKTTLDVPVSQSAPKSCSHENARLLATVHEQSQDHTNDLSDIFSLSHKSMKEDRNDYSQCFLWRKLYTDVAVVWSLLDILRAGRSNESKGSEYWRSIVERLDHAIIIAGAAGEGRLDLVLDAIEKIQYAHLPRLPSNDLVIPRFAPGEASQDHELSPNGYPPVVVLSSPPSISAFRTDFCHQPFILRRFADEWPSICERRWASKAYLQSAAGRGRTVPVEIGRDYRSDDWTQRMMDWDEFLDYLFADVDSGREVDRGRKEIMYLAQHDLFKQFPALREDVVPPDYVYASLSPPEHYPQYRPPNNDEELVLNTWIGPAGAASPAHVDPFYNFYTQVIGRKTVWLAPPDVSHVLSPHSASSDYWTSSDGSESGTSILDNTTHLDVFASGPILQREKEFVQTVLPVATSAVLDEGDMLFFPPGWWHAFRSETTSISISMWF